MYPDGDVEVLQGRCVVNIIHNCGVLYKGPPPDRDYNKAIAYMEDFLQRGVLVRWWVTALYTVKRRIGESVGHRFKRSCRAFRKEWSKETLTGNSDVLDNDDIPY